LADSSSIPDLAALEFRTRLGPAPTLSSEHTRRERCAVGLAERYLRRLVHPDLYDIRPTLPKAPPKNPAAMGTVIAVPQMVPLLFIHSTGRAWPRRCPIGLMGGVVTAGYLDLSLCCVGFLLACLSFVVEISVPIPLGVLKIPRTPPRRIIQLYISFLRLAAHLLKIFIHVPHPFSQT